MRVRRGQGITYCGRRKPNREIVTASTSVLLLFRGCNAVVRALRKLALTRLERVLARGMTRCASSILGMRLRALKALLLNLAVLLRTLRQRHAGIGHNISIALRLHQVELRHGHKALFSNAEEAFWWGDLLVTDLLQKCTLERKERLPFSAFAYENLER